MAKIYEALLRASKIRKESAARSAHPASEEVFLKNSLGIAQELKTTLEQEQKPALKQNVQQMRPVPAVAEEMPPLRAPFIVDEDVLALIECIESLLSQKRKQIIQFLGSREGEAASTIAFEYARVAATRIGLSVLLSDLDKLHSSLHLFSSQGPEGRWLEAINDFRDAEKMNGHQDPGLFDIASANLIAPTFEVFDSDVTKPFWELLRKRFDLLVIDSASINDPSDALAAVHGIDAVVLVFESEKVEWTRSGSVADVGLSLVMESIERSILAPQNVLKCNERSLLLLTPIER